MRSANAAQRIEEAADDWAAWNADSDLEMRPLFAVLCLITSVAV